MLPRTRSLSAASAARVVPLAALALTAGLGCSGAQPPQHLRVSVAPLQLDDITDADYTITVTNNLGDTVWSEDVTSTQYGDGKGALTYIGACDASADAQPNHVRLDLHALHTGPGGATTLPASEWRNPTPVTRDVVCVENQDVFVAFDLVLMRSAQQGFFDVAVNFEDIFCSAKADCVGDLLHNPTTGERDLTEVIAFACTAGPGQETFLYWGDAKIVCRDGERVTATYPIDPAQAPGQHGPIYAAGTTPGATRPGLFENAIYRDSEEFQQSQDIDKCFWNLALGIDQAALGKDCTFEATATASNGKLDEPPFHTPDGGVYPIIRWKVPLTDKTGGLLCKTNPLDGENSGVTTEYTTTAGLGFETGAACGGDPISAALACSGTPADHQGVSFAPNADGTVTVTAGGHVVGSYALPRDTHLANECCADPCCEETP